MLYWKDPLAGGSRFWWGTLENQTCLSGTKQPECTQELLLSTSLQSGFAESPAFKPELHEHAQISRITTMPCSYLLHSMNNFIFNYYNFFNLNHLLHKPGLKGYNSAQLNGFLISADLNQLMSSSFFVSWIRCVLVEITQFCGPEGAGLKNVDLKFDSLNFKTVSLTSFGTVEHPLTTWKDTNVE